MSKIVHLYLNVFWSSTFSLNRSWANPPKNGIFQFAHHSSLILINRSFALEIKVCSRAMSERIIWKSDVPSSANINPLLLLAEVGATKSKIVHALVLLGKWRSSYLHNWRVGGAKRNVEWENSPSTFQYSSKFNRFWSFSTKFQKKY